MTSFKQFADACKNIEKITSSLEMTDQVADLLAKVDTDELPVVTHFIMGQIFPSWSSQELGIGESLLYTALSKASGLSVDDIENIIRDTGDIGETAVRALSKLSRNQVTFSSFVEEPTPQITILEVSDRLKRIANVSGKGSQNQKVKNLQYLFNASSPEEARYLSRLAVEELRIGVGEGIVRDAISKAFNVPVEKLERSFMLTNDLGAVAVAAQQGGEEEVSKLDIQVNRPVRMMLAQVTPSIETAFNEMGTAAIEWKFDGARVQIHKDKEEVNIFSRKLENVTNSLPDIVESVKNQLNADTAIIDGEAVAIDEDGRPRAFQDILRRFRRKYDVLSTSKEIPIILNMFDLMYLDGESYIDLPLKYRREILGNIVENTKSIKVDKQILTSDVEEANRVYNNALSAGHEGIMIKNPESPYSPGKRGKNWLKKKPIMETLDLVVIGGEWGYGRRANLIGSYAIACYDRDRGQYLPIGKVATGITDEKLEELTSLFSDLIVSEKGRKIEFKPEIVFEIGFEEIQKSNNYESGYALRFPRLVNVRDDKSPEESDTIERIEDIYLKQRSRNHNNSS
ncbi:DNA ligase I, ATP-dependent Dnl1 [Methanohalobium evestigatum Z-7303]|uniref:DNA ligase n=1 Tax=Methanohalobium evestigatum (strain ATCC BAA-1072 / DSM 3721 / NBRC 107634 / OCM 161 / Z-7303) TaxID=644295 RepID=D7E8W6_METEZ|nr:ATP-dependent DNA ligase [Methanohalobium evestigatum]ADI73787.1 DNA ligase I, ATP-dependent Dnl1 [Methanohalobium evestigatum Z-7303]